MLVGQVAQNAQRYSQCYPLGGLAGGAVQGCPSSLAGVRGGVRLSSWTMRSGMAGCRLLPRAGSLAGHIWLGDVLVLLSTCASAGHHTPVNCPVNRCRGMYWCCLIDFHDVCALECCCGLGRERIVRCALRQLVLSAFTLQSQTFHVKFINFHFWD